MVKFVRTQSYEDSIVPFLMLHRDGTPATGLISSDFNIRVFDLTTSQEITGFDTPSIIELDGGYYNSIFSKDATNKVFTDETGEKTYAVLFSMAATGSDIDPTMVTVRSIREYDWYKILKNSMSPMLIPITLSVYADGGSALPDTKVSLYDGSGNIIASLNTDNNGQISLGLEENDYIAYITKTGYNPEAFSFSVSETGNNNFNVYLTAITYSPAASGNLCRIHIDVRDFQLTPKKDIKIYVDIADLPQTINSRVAITNKKTLLTDENGYAYFDAAQGATIYVNIPEARLKTQFIVPSLASANLADLV